MHSQRLGQCIFAPTLAIVAIACGESVIEPLRTPGMRIIAPSTVDTVGTFQDFQVELTNDDGTAAAGELVQFTVHALPGVPGNPLEIRAGITGFFNQGSTGLTDEAGVLNLTVRFTFVAGGAYVLLTVPSRTLTDSLLFTVEPGVPVDVTVAPLDTAMLVGGAYTLRPHGLDSYGNLRDDPFTFSVAEGPASVDASGRVSGEAIGRVTLRAASSGFAGIVQASVVPNVTLAAFAHPNVVGRIGGVFVFRSDGADGRMVWQRTFGPTESEGFEGAWPAWAPSGTEIAFIDAGTILVTDLDGAVREVGPTSGPSASLTDGLQYGADGTWLYFTREFGAWRVRPDGSGLEELVAFGPRPSPSPDGGAVAFQSGPQVSSARLRILTLATGEVSSLPVPGYYPQWMRTGTHIVYVGGDNDNRIHTMLANGNDTTLVGRGRGVPHGYSVSPDGTWYVGYSIDGLELVEIATGMILPLRLEGPQGQDLIQPTWGPVRP